jgi:hypothetical protein
MLRKAGSGKVDKAIEESNHRLGTTVGDVSEERSKSRGQDFQKYRPI